MANLLDEAWDQLGGRKNTPLIYHFSPDARRRERARREIEQALALDPRSRRGQRYKALYLNASGNTGSSIKNLRRLLESDPRDSNALSDLAGILREQRQFAEAADLATRAIRLDPQNAALHSNLGLTRMVQGRLAEAAAEFARAVEIDASDARVHIYYANALAALGRVQEAREEAEVARGLAANDPDDPELRPYLSDLLAALKMTVAPKSETAEADANPKEPVR